MCEGSKHDDDQAAEIAQHLALPDTEIEETMCGLKFRVSAGAFFQVGFGFQELVGFSKILDRASRTTPLEDAMSVRIFRIELSR